MRKTVPFIFNQPKQQYFIQKMLGQILFYPPNVAGWKGDKSWIDSNTLMFRLKLASVLLNNAIINIEEKGEFEDSFEKYYSKTKRRKQLFKITKDWDSFDLTHESTSLKELQQFLITSELDEDTELLLNNLEIKDKRSFCIQLMSLPEYQLC